MVNYTLINLKLTLDPNAIMFVRRLRTLDTFLASNDPGDPGPSMESGDGFDTLESGRYGGMVTEIFLPTEVTLVAEMPVIIGMLAVDPVEEPGMTGKPDEEEGGAVVTLSVRPSSTEQINFITEWQTIQKIAKLLVLSFTITFPPKHELGQGESSIGLLVCLQGWKFCQFVGQIKVAHLILGTS